jgi:hypothetical protein
MSKKKKDAKNIFDAASEIFVGEEERRKKKKRILAAREEAARSEGMTDPLVRVAEESEPPLVEPSAPIALPTERVKEKKRKGSGTQVKREAAGSTSLVQSLTSESKKEELKEVYDALNQIRSDLEEKLEKMFHKAKLTKEELNHYLTNPGNFTALQWDAIEQARKEEKAKMWSLLGVEEQKKALEKESKREKRKGLAGRKKGWFRVD